MRTAPVTRDLLARDPVEVAPELLGSVLSRVDDDGVVRSGRIVEVEAYRGEDDPASHAYRGPTPRTRVMFGPAGHLYVYRSYGIHWCANIVCGDDGVAAAVLLRGLEPLRGIEAMYRDRPRARRDSDLGSGPGKLCAALGVSGADGGMDLCADPSGRIRLTDDGFGAARIRRGPRVGVTSATEQTYRFWVADNRHVSGPRSRN